MLNGVMKTSDFFVSPPNPPKLDYGVLLKLLELVVCYPKGLEL